MSRISAVSTPGSASGPSPRRVGVEQPGGVQVPLGRGVEREPERLGRGQRHRHPVRHDRLAVRVARRAGSRAPGRRSGRRWRAGCARRRCRSRGRRTSRPAPSARAPRVSEPSRTARPERAGEQRQRLLRPHVGDRVGAAVGHPLLGLLGVEVGVPARGVALQRVAQDVHPGRRGHHRRLGQRSASGRRRPASAAARGWLIPVFTFSDSTSSTQIVVLSAPVPVVVGTATSGSSGVAGRVGLADRRVDVVHQLAGVGRAAG